MKHTTLNEKKYTRLIWILSIVIPIAVAALFRIRIPGVERLGFLPPVYAGINALTAGNLNNHETLMKFAIFLSVLFLVFYVVYHMTSDSTKFGGEGFIKYVYYFILTSHIFLSILVIPFVLFTYLRGISGQFEEHKKIARYTFPLWLYVAVTGVIVYFMISPYY